MMDQVIEKAGAQVEAAKAQAFEIKAFFDNATNTISYVVHDRATRRAAVIDSVLDYDPAAGRTSHESADAVIAYVEAQGLTVD